jgi:hypothetical protein
VQYPFLDKIRTQMEQNLHSIDKGIGFEAEFVFRTTAIEQLRKCGYVRAFDILQRAFLEDLKDLWRNARFDRSALDVAGRVICNNLTRPFCWKASRRKRYRLVKPRRDESVCDERRPSCDNIAGSMIQPRWIQAK